MDKEVIQTMAEKEVKERMERINIVASPEYKEWIYDFLNKYNCIHDESALYLYEGIDRAYGILCSYFHSYLINNEKLPCIEIPEEHGLGHFYTPFKIHDKEYIIQTLIGQGAATWITRKEDAFTGEEIE